MRAALAAVAVVALWGTAQAGGREPDWRAFADCAAAYRANARIADPERAASMTAEINEVADQYRREALKRHREPVRVERASPYVVAVVRVDNHIAARIPVFAGKSRAALERFIEACPQVDPG
jgi:hypothetical protein